MGSGTVEEWNLGRTTITATTTTTTIAAAVRVRVTAAATTTIAAATTATTVAATTAIYTNKLHVFAIEESRVPGFKVSVVCARAHVHMHVQVCV